MTAAPPKLRAAPATEHLAPLEALPVALLQGMLRPWLILGDVLCLTETSQTLARALDGLLVHADFFQSQGRDPAALARFLHRHPRLESLGVWRSSILPALAPAIAQGACRALDSLWVRVNHQGGGGQTDEDDDHFLTHQHVQGLTAALLVDGALPVLEDLMISPLGPGMTALFTGALAQRPRALPALRHLDLGDDEVNEEDLRATAAMLTARTDAGCCQGMETLPGTWLDYGSEDARRQWLRHLLPSVTTLLSLPWDLAYEACFVSDAAPGLVRLHLSVDEDVYREMEEGDYYCPNKPPSVAVWEAMPALESVELHLSDAPELAATALDILIEALGRGRALTHLQELAFLDSPIGDEHMSRFLRALAQAPCAAHLRELSLSNGGGGGLGLQSMAYLALLLAEKRFPNLTYLDVHGNNGMAAAMSSSPASSWKGMRVMSTADGMQVVY